MIESFSPDAVAAMKAHALASYPNESCGFVLADGTYLALDNVHETPTENFRIDASDYMNNPGILAVVHSHPQSNAYDYRLFRAGFYPDCPSPDDLLGQANSGIPWGIVVTDGENAKDPFFWGDFTLELPLYDRAWRKGVEDEYAFVAKFYWQNYRLKLGNRIRQPGWWITSRNEDSHVADDFIRVYAEDEKREGDIGLLPVGDSSVIQPFVYLGGGTMGYHSPDTLSTRGVLGLMTQQINFWIRHKGAVE